MDDTVNITIENPKDAKHAVSVRSRSDMTGRDGEAISVAPGSSTTVRVTAHAHVAVSLGAFAGEEGAPEGALDPAPAHEEGSTGDKDPAETGE